MAAHVVGVPWMKPAVLATLFNAVQEKGWTGFDIRRQDLKAEDLEKAAVSVTVFNEAEQEVRLANCDENHVVPAGEKLSLTVKDKIGFWVVPKEVQWNCKDGPFELFAFGADLSVLRPQLGIGVNVQPDKFEKHGQEAKTTEKPSTKEKPEQTPSYHVNGPIEEIMEEIKEGAKKRLEEGKKKVKETKEGAEQHVEKIKEKASEAVKGVVLVAPGEGVHSVACFDESCTEALDLDDLPEQVELHIIGPKGLQAPSGTFLANHGHGGRHHHRHGGHRHGGHRHGGHRHWPWWRRHHHHRHRWNAEAAP